MDESGTMTGSKRAARARRDDLAAIEAACEAMKIGEFDLFRRAWRAWFAREADEKRLEAVFVAYLFHREVPAWVRHFCRRVLAEDAAIRPAVVVPAAPSVSIAPVAAPRIAALAVVAAVAFLFVASLAGNSRTNCAGATAAGTAGDLGRAITVAAGLSSC